MTDGPRPPVTKHTSGVMFRQLFEDMLADHEKHYEDHGAKGVSHNPVYESLRKNMDHRPIRHQLLELAQSRGLIHY